MSQNIRDKTAQFRLEFRKKQIEQYRNKVRNEILVNNQKEQEKYEMNQIIKQLISKMDIEQLYNHLYADNCKNKLSMLTYQNIANLFELIYHQLEKIQAILMLTSLIQIYYKEIFLNVTLQNTCKMVVKKIYELVNLGVGSIRNGLEEQNYKKTLHIVNGFLNCLKSLFLNQDEKSEENYKFSEYYNPYFLRTYLYTWFDILYSSPIYIIILILAEGENQIFSEPYYQQYLQNNYHLLVKLIQQIDPNKSKKSVLTLPSLILLNSIIRQVKNPKIIVQLLPAFLQATVLVYGCLQQKQKRYFKISSFIQMLQNARFLFESLSEKQLVNNIGQIMRSTNFWTFCTVILRVQTQSLRLQIFTMLKFAIKNILYNHDKLQDYISPTQISFFIEGLQQQNPYIIKQAIEIVYILVKYSDKSTSQPSYICLMEQYQILTILQNLQYHSNKEIGQISTQLIPFFSQDHGNQMSIEL